MTATTTISEPFESPARKHWPLRLAALAAAVAIPVAVAVAVTDGDDSTSRPIGDRVAAVSLHTQSADASERWNLNMHRSETRSADAAERWNLNLQRPETRSADALERSASAALTRPVGCQAEARTAEAWERCLAGR